MLLVEEVEDADDEDPDEFDEELDEAESEPLDEPLLFEPVPDEDFERLSVR